MSGAGRSPSARQRQFRARARFHSIIAISCAVSLGTGLVAFDWSWEVSFPLREDLFAVHRAAGMIGMATSLAWLLYYRLPRNSFAHGGRRHLLVRGYQVGLAALAVAMGMLAWIGRALDGRWIELVSPLPVYNFVSRPDAPLAHALLSFHAYLSGVMLAAVMVHATFAGAHWLRDRTRRRTRAR